MAGEAKTAELMQELPNIPSEQCISDNAAAILDVGSPVGFPVLTGIDRAPRRCLCGQQSSVVDDGCATATASPRPWVERTALR
eukprot:2909977-Rhodomonas_salina.1